jgi:hypothetical protein
MEPDLFNPATEADVLYGAGHVIGGAGQTTFAGSRQVGDASGSIFAPLGLPAPGLQDAPDGGDPLRGSSHGPAIPGLVSDMIHTFNGGCQPLGAPFPDPLPPEYARPARTRAWTCSSRYISPDRTEEASEEKARQPCGRRAFPCAAPARPAGTVAHATVSIKPMVEPAG